MIPVHVSTSNIIKSSEEVTSGCLTNGSSDSSSELLDCGSSAASCTRLKSGCNNTHKIWRKHSDLGHVGGRGGGGALISKCNIFVYEKKRRKAMDRKYIEQWYRCVRVQACVGGVVGGY